MFFMLVRGCVGWRSGGVESVVERDGRVEALPGRPRPAETCNLGSARLDVQWNVARRV